MSYRRSTEKILLDVLHFGLSGITKMTAGAQIFFWWPSTDKDFENEAKHCVACMSSGENLKNPIPKNFSRKLEKLTETGQEIQIDFTRKSNDKMNSETEILLPLGRWNTARTAQICKTSDSREPKIFSNCLA